MKRNKLFKLLFALIISLPALSQTNPRLVNENYMHTVLFEDFLGTQLNRSQWHIDPFKRSLGVLADDPRTLQVLNGNLELKMIYSPNYTCGGYTGDYVGSEIITNTTYQYGSFECRAKFAYQNASWPAFWLFGGDAIPCTQGGKINEIDIAELKCEDSNLTIDHVIHYYYSPSECDGEQQDIHYSWMNFDSNFHLFKCIWSPNKVTYYIDGVQTHQVVNSGQGWFPSRSLEIRLSQQIIDPIGAVITPQTSYFDYVRVKQFFLSPEITIPSIVCSTGTATLDVDALASNITWQLTPSSLFTTSSGSGKIANIVRAGGAVGTGNITYTFQMPGGETFTVNKNINVGSLPTPVISGNTTVKCGNELTYKLDEANTNGGATFLWDSSILEITEGETASQCKIIGGDFNGNGTISCTVTACGVAKTGTFNVRLICESKLSLLITPNPSSDETIIELVSGEEKIPVEDMEWSLEVYDQSQNLKTKVSKDKVNKHVINTSGWKEGLYIVRAVVGDEIISEKLRVEH